MNEIKFLTYRGVVSETPCIPSYYTYIIKYYHRLINVLWLLAAYLYIL